MTCIKVLKFGEQNVMVNDVEGLFEVDKQGTNRALTVESLQLRLACTSFSRQRRIYRFVVSAVQLNTFHISPSLLLHAELHSQPIKHKTLQYNKIHVQTNTESAQCLSMKYRRTGTFRTNCTQVFNVVSISLISL